MKIFIRRKNTWRVVENKDKRTCDKCGKSLWVGPGRGKFCNTIDHYAMEKPASL